MTAAPHETQRLTEEFRQRHESHEKLEEKRKQRETALKMDHNSTYSGTESYSIFTTRIPLSVREPKTDDCLQIIQSTRCKYPKYPAYEQPCVESGRNA
ncbi:hypothetical protein BaRGS_00040416 [Batillaria attramentaria]|uniref:Uncharacterized protein n=1 Tax=Batillaria attramentaria TaxID=370345 RepID=A0ABD0J077_9CAEN